MGLKEDLPVLAGMLLVLAGVVFAAGSSGLPGIGSFDNPFDEISSGTGDEDVDSYDVTTQLNVGTTLTGDTEIGDFTYQTQPSCNFCLSIADGSQFSIGGASNVKADVRVVNQDTGKVYVQTTKFLGELDGGETKRVDVNWDNARAGTYLVRYIVTYDPDAFDLTDLDNVKRKRYNIQVPKVRNQ